MIEYRTNNGTGLVLKSPGVLEVYFRHLQRAVGSASGMHATIGEAASANVRAMGCPDWLAKKVGARMQRRFEERSAAPMLCDLDKVRDMVNRQQAEDLAKVIAADKLK
jgi:hypothetical protein